jgi:parvulin-like peptidyl-prolyl isomerase
MTRVQLLSPSPNEVVDLLKEQLKLRDLYQAIWRQQIIEATAEEKGITVSPEEVQAESDQHRQDNQLQKAEDTLKWLAEHQVTVDDWEVGIRNRLLRRKLAHHLFASEVEKYFAQNRLNYEQLLLYRIVVDSHPLAQELCYQIEERELSFYEAANLYDINEARRYRCGFEGKVYRKNLHPMVAAEALSAPVGEVVGPIEIEEKYHLFLIQEFIPAQLTEARSQEIIFQLFDEWLTTEMNYILYNQ